MAVDSAGTLDVADFANNRIIKGMPIYPWLSLAFDPFPA